MATAALDESKLSRRPAVPDRTVDRRVEVAASESGWKFLVAGGVVPLGMSAAAAVSTYLSNSDRVAVAAWVATAVVGTASVISAAAASQSRARSHQKHVEDPAPPAEAVGASEFE